MATQISDSELVQTMLGGDKEAFAELYRRRQRDVYRFALHMTGAPDLAEDVTQEVFRSEEHTSELQSRGQLVCRLLLEKKKAPKPRHTLPAACGPRTIPS